MITPKLTLPEAAPAADREAASKKYVDDNRASPITINMLTTAPSAVGQGTWTYLQGSGEPLLWSFYNSTTTDGDNFSVLFSASSGAYKLEFNAPKNSSRGKLDVFLDDLKIINALDLYAASFTAANFATVNIDIDAGTHVLKFVINGKNASSSNYGFQTSGISLTRTGDIV